MLDDPTKLNTTTDATLPKPAATTAGAGTAAATIASAGTPAASPLTATAKPTGNGLAAGLKAPAMQAPSLNDSVADKVKELTSQDSPLMQQAKTVALKTANRRGLLNSSMAVGAAQDATVRTALPIAAQDASQAFQKNMQANDQTWQSGEKQLDRDQQTSIVDKQITSTEGLAAQQRALEEKLQANTITAAEKQQLADIKSREGLASAQRDLDLLMQTNSISASDRQQIRQIQSTEGIAAADRALQELLQSRAIASQERMQDKDLGSRASLQQNEIASNQSMQQKEITYQTTMRGLDRDLQEKLASWNLKSADRNAAAQFLTNMQSAYDDGYNAIMANPNLDASTRSSQLASIKNLRDKNLNLVEQMYQVDLKWTDADFGIATPAATPAAATPAAMTATAGAKAFDGAAYLAANPDVADTPYVANPALHYEMFGRNEGRTW